MGSQCIQAQLPLLPMWEECSNLWMVVDSPLGNTPYPLNIMLAVVDQAEYSLAWCKAQIK